MGQNKDKPNNHTLRLLDILNFFKQIICYDLNSLHDVLILSGLLY